MDVAIKIPELGESIQEVQIGKWLKAEGDAVAQDEDIVELETDKASMELPAPATGVLEEIVKKEGEVVAIGDVIARLGKQDDVPREVKGSDSNGATGRSAAVTGDDGNSMEETHDEANDEPTGDEESQSLDSQGDAPAARSDEPSSASASSAAKRSGKRDEEATIKRRQTQEREQRAVERKAPGKSVVVTPTARRALREHGLSAHDIELSGEKLRLQDVRRHVRERQKDERNGAQRGSTPSVPEVRESELEQLTPMSPIRQGIAERLVEAQQVGALLTTVNEIDMSAVVSLRREFREEFENEYEIDLGYMPFFVKAVVDSLRRFPKLNAEIRDDEILYRNYFHIGIAVGDSNGLVVPVLRFAERMSFAEIEKAIGGFVERARSNKLEPSVLEGGTFTITNGGVYGSLLSTPIVNPPQSGVLGMHAIQRRPVARDELVVIRPMMYVAVTYDHRLVDGREAVLFLGRVKSAIEEPSRMLMEV